MTCAASAVPAAHPPVFDPHAHSSAPPYEDPVFDPDDRQFDDETHFADSSAPSISLDSSRSEYRRMVEYVLGLFPQASGVPPSAPPPRALFESLSKACPLRLPCSSFRFEVLAEAFSGIGVMSLAPHSWRVSCGSLGNVGGLGRRLLGCPGPSFGLSSPFCFSASSICCAASSSQLLSRLHVGHRSFCCGVRLTRQRHYQTCISGSGVLQQALCNPQGWRPVIDLSRLNRFVRLSRFRIKTSASVLQSLRPGDWMVSLDLQDAYQPGWGSYLRQVSLH